MCANISKARQSSVTQWWCTLCGSVCKTFARRPAGRRAFETSCAHKHVGPIVGVHGDSRDIHSANSIEAAAVINERNCR